MSLIHCIAVLDIDHITSERVEGRDGFDEPTNEHMPPMIPVWTSALADVDQSKSQLVEHNEGVIGF